MKIFLIHIFMSVFWYYVNIYLTSCRVVYHVAENIVLPNKVLLNYNMFFIIYCCVELNYQCPILLKADQISWTDMNNKNYSRHIANTHFFLISLNSFKILLVWKREWVFRNSSLSVPELSRPYEQVHNLQ